MTQGTKMTRIGLIIAGLILVGWASVWLTAELMKGTGYPIRLISSVPEQPVNFRHDRHLALGLECVACHTGAVEGTHAGIPPTLFCASCHRVNPPPPAPAEPSPSPEASTNQPPSEAGGNKSPPEIITNESRLKPAAPIPPALRRFLEADEEIPWRQSQRVPRHVFFSHRRHVSIAKLECAVCHGDMTQASAPAGDAVFPRNLSGMNRCVDCHRTEKVSTDCLACHH